MTNLKKVVALTLAMSSLLSTVALANFNDQNEITLTEAVDTLVALNVIIGYEDGSFRPENNVTRAEMAKMIFTIKNGGSDDAKSFKDLSSSFTDISGHWAEGYIKYCQTQGIIDGKSDTIFDPDSDVTGTESLKMSLVLLGYRTDKSGLVGDNWTSNTMAIASTAGLTSDYIGSFANSAQRQSAAQILYNALYTETVKYSNTYEDYTGTDQTLAQSAMNLETYEDVYISDSDVKKGVYFTMDAQLETQHNASPLDTERNLVDNIGQKVDILADAKTGQVYGLKTSLDNQVIRTFANNITISGTEGSKTAKYNNVEIDITDEQALEIEQAMDNATVYIVYNGDVVMVDIVQAIVGKVSFVNSSKINVSVTDFTAGQLTFADDNIPSDVAKDDYVQIIKDDYNNNYTVEILELKTGTVEAKRDGEFRIDGTWYSVYSGDTNPSLNSEVSFYAVGSVIYDVDADLGIEGDYAYVIAVEQSSDSSLDSKNRAQIVLSDGSVVIVNTEIYEIGNVSKLVEYEITDETYTFSAIDEKDYTFTQSTGNIYEDDKLAGTFVSNEAVIFVTYEDDEHIVLSGEVVNDWDDVLVSATAENVILYTNITNGINYVELAYINLGSLSLPNEAGRQTYAYVVDEPYSIREDGTNYVVLTVFDGSKTYIVKSEKADGIMQGDFVEFDEKDGYTKEVTAIDGADIDKITGYASRTGKIVFETAGQADITDDSVIIYIDSEEILGVESGSIELADDVTGDEIVENNVFVKVVDGEVVIMFVDVNNHMK